MANKRMYKLAADMIDIISKVLDTGSGSTCKGGKKGGERNTGLQCRDIPTSNAQKLALASNPMGKRDTMLSSSVKKMQILPLPYQLNAQLFPTPVEAVSSHSAASNEENPF